MNSETCKNCGDPIKPHAVLAGWIHANGWTSCVLVPFSAAPVEGSPS